MEPRLKSSYGTQFPLGLLFHTQNLSEVLSLLDCNWWAERWASTDDPIEGRSALQWGNAVTFIPPDLEWQRVLEVIWLHPSFIIEFTCSTKHLLIAPRPENLPREPTPGEHSLAQNHCAHGTKHGDCSVALTRNPEGSGSPF